MSLPTSIIRWRDYATDPPSPINGYFLLLRKRVKGLNEEAGFPVEAQRWAGVNGEPLTFYQSDGEDEIQEDDILYWADLPEVPYQINHGEQRADARQDARNILRDVLACWCAGEKADQQTEIRDRAMRVLSSRGDTKQPTHEKVVDLARMLIRGGYLDDEINSQNPIALELLDAVGDDRLAHDAVRPIPNQEQ